MKKGKAGVVIAFAIGIGKAIGLPYTVIEIDTTFPRTRTSKLGFLATRRVQTSSDALVGNISTTYFLSHDCRRVCTSKASFGETNKLPSVTSVDLDMFFSSKYCTTLYGNVRTVWGCSHDLDHLDPTSAVVRCCGSAVSHRSRPGSMYLVYILYVRISCVMQISPGNHDLDCADTSSVYYHGGTCIVFRTKYS